MLESIIDKETGPLEIHLISEEVTTLRFSKNIS